LKSFYRWIFVEVIRIAVVGQNLLIIMEIIMKIN